MVDACGADVHRGGGEATHIGEQVVFGVMCEVVGLGDAESLKGRFQAAERLVRYRG